MWSPASMLYTYFVLPSWTLRSPWQQHFRPSIQEYHQNQVQITAANNGIRAIIWAWFSILLSVVTFTKSHTHSACESNVLPGLLTNKGPFKNSSSFLDPTPFILVNSIEFMIMRTAVVNIMLHYIFRLQRTLLPRIQLQEQGVFLSFVPQNVPLFPCPLYPSALYPPSTSKDPMCRVFDLFVHYRFCSLKISDLIQLKPIWSLARWHLWHSLSSFKISLPLWPLTNVQCSQIGISSFVFGLRVDYLTWNSANHISWIYISSEHDRIPWANLLWVSQGGGGKQWH